MVLINEDDHTPRINWKRGGGGGDSGINFWERQSD